MNSEQMPVCSILKPSVFTPKSAYSYCCVTGELAITECWAVRGAVGPVCYHLFVSVGDGDREDDLSGYRIC